VVQSERLDPHEKEQKWIHNDRRRTRSKSI